MKIIKEREYNSQMIKEVHIKNFKSILNETIKFDRFSVIVGNNGVGKTNLLNVISFVKELATGIKLDSAVANITFISTELFNKNSGSTECELKFVLQNGDESEYLYEIKISLRKQADVSKLVINHERLLVRDVSGSLKEVFTRVNDELNNTEGKKIPLALGSNEAGISQYKDPITLKVKEIFNKTYVPSVDLPELVDKVSDYIFRLSKDSLKYEKFMLITKKLLPSLNSFENVVFSPAKTTASPHEDDYLMLFTEKNMKGRLSFEAISHGDLRTLYYLAAGILSSEHATFLFDEIENGIHPERICKIIDFLDNISRTTKKQFIFSTHSTRIINSVRPQEVIYVGKEANKGSYFVSLNGGAEIDQVTRVLENGGDLYEYLQARFPR